jgi:hypothetical protein
MANRRSLGAALNLPPDKEAFIRQGVSAAPKPMPADLPQPAKPSVEAQATEPAEPVRADHEEEEAARHARRPRSRRGRATAIPREPLNTYPGITNLLVPLTTRLQPSTAAALKRAGLEQRLRGQEPATVQEIAEEAIQRWLEENGYLA